jgi:dTDP-4-dehydrorhamnose reductase
MAKKKVLIFGGHGLVGSAIAKHFENDDLVMPTHEELPIQNKYAVQQLVDYLKPDEIYLCAAYTNVDACETDPKAHKVNVLGVHNVVTSAGAEWARVVFISSAYVFDGEKKLPYDIFDTPSPMSVYGLQKWAAEAIIYNHCKNFLIARTMAVFGKEAKRKNFAYQVIDNLSKGQIVYAPEDQLMSPIHADELAFGITEHLADYNGIAHINGATSMSKMDFAKRIATRFGYPEYLVRPLPYQQAAMRPKNAVLQNSVGVLPFAEQLEKFYVNH